MKYQVYTLRDLKSESFGRPIFARAEGEVLRDLRSEVNRKAEDNRLFLYPEDFELFYLGAWDDLDGSAAYLRVPRLVCSCSSLVAVSSPPASGGSV